MNHDLTTRYIKFDSLVDRAACKELVHLFLGRQIRSNWPEHGYHYHAFLLSSICELLAKKSPRLKTIVLSQGYIDKAVLDHCLPLSVKQVLFDRVTVCGFGTFPFYKHNITIKRDVLRTGNTIADTEDRMWQLGAVHCAQLTPDDLEATFIRIRKAKELGKLKYELLTDIVERYAYFNICTHPSATINSVLALILFSRQPTALKDGRWSADSSDLNTLGNLTLMELFTFTSCTIYSAMSDSV